MLQPRATNGDSSWFVQARFGMFIHLGIYAAPARHEWALSWEEIPEAQYRRHFDHFDPDRFDAQSWARTAREAGMRYVVITAKHHDGFCLWDSEFTDYKATKTPCRRDLLRAMVDAFRAEGLRLGFYYSLLDWHHSEFPIDRFHPRRNHPDAGRWNETRDVRRYAAYMRNQVRELLTGYGPIDILWFDFSYPEKDESVPLAVRAGKGRNEWESEEMLRLVRELAPKALVNNRLDLAHLADDFLTPEQWQPQEWMRDLKTGEPMVWETCQTFSGSWGYHRDESSWKSPEQLICMLVRSVSCGGNLLMNVGPTARGTFDRRALDALGVFRDWMALHQRAIYGCTQSEFRPAAGCLLTQNVDRKRLYIHVTTWPFRHLHLPEMSGRVAYAQLLHDASEVAFSEAGEGAVSGQGVQAGCLTFHLPVQKPDVVVPVIEVFLK